MKVEHKASPFGEMEDVPKSSSSGNGNLDINKVLSMFLNSKPCMYKGRKNNKQNAEKTMKNTSNMQRKASKTHCSPHLLQTL